MNNYFTTNDRSNPVVLGTTAEGVSALIPQDIDGDLADKLRQTRKVNPDTPVQTKSAAPWYRRFGKR